MISDYRLLTYHVRSMEDNYGISTPDTAMHLKRSSYKFKNTVKLISIEQAVAKKYLGIHNLSDYKLRKVKQSLEALIPIDLEALCFKEVSPECILL